MQVIIEAAEKAAAGVIADAEEQARRIVEAAEAEANHVAAERLRATAAELEAAPWERPAPRLRPVEDTAEPAGHEPAAVPGQGGSAGARLLATQMAVSGSSREEIEARLRNGFQIEDAGEILDAILGPGER